MSSKTTNSVEISAIPEYDAKNSSPSANRYVFKYDITITNNGDLPIKIEKRRWFIYDFGFGISEVSGNGVIGLTPEIAPGESFSYFSFVNLQSPTGFMQGSYFAEVDGNKTLTEIEIPRFNLIARILEN